MQRIGGRISKNKTSKTIPVNLLDYREYLVSSLKKSPEEAISYLNAALADGDPKVFLVVLGDVAESRGIPKPRNLTGILNLLDGLGFRLAIEKRKAS